MVVAAQPPGRHGRRPKENRPGAWMPAAEGHGCPAAAPGFARPGRTGRVSAGQEARERTSARKKLRASTPDRCCDGVEGRGRSRSSDGLNWGGGGAQGVGDSPGTSPGRREARIGQGRAGFGLNWIGYSFGHDVAALRLGKLDFTIGFGLGGTWAGIAFECSGRRRGSRPHQPADRPRIAGVRDEGGGAGNSSRRTARETKCVGVRVSFQRGVGSFTAALFTPRV